jgi:uncharacterized SAM-binding protein YcdF (DUF218 family)
VTAPTHARRTAKVFKKALRDQARVIVWPETFSEFDNKQWWKDHEQTQLVVWEYVSLVYYWFLGY